MTTIFIAALVITLLIAGAFLVRVVIGPTIFDRVIAVNGVGTLSPVALVIVGLIYDRTDMFVDLALALLLLNLFTTLLIARYAQRKAAEE